MAENKSLFSFFFHSIFVLSFVMVMGFMADCGCGGDGLCWLWLWWVFWPVVGVVVIFFFPVVVMVVACSELQVMGSCLQLCLVEVVEVVVAVVVVVYQYYYI